MQNTPLFYTFNFYLFGIIAIVSAVVFVTRKSPVAAALWLVNTMFSLAAIYIMLDAPFIGAIQVLVYAGAIMVVFLFVIMLLNLGHPSELADIRSQKWRLIAALVGIAMLAEIFVLTRSNTVPELTGARDAAANAVLANGAVGSVATSLFTTYLLPFEITSVLLLAAIVGAVMIGKQRSANAR
ncbi:MAG TPA: NADH-quinone oxidoreductase subunit J [Gemmatimonadaceae bacterium]|nr:NADH-quinone oxidoreductase subunit J [Gemmatimonadaceae bacterium]